MKFLLALSLLGLLAPAFAQDQARDYAAIQELVESTKALAAADLSCDTKNDCEVLELGSMACGGPQDFALTSKKNRNLAEVKFLAQRTVDREDEYNRLYGIFSICILRVPNKVKCAANACAFVR